MSNGFKWLRNKVVRTQDHWNANKIASFLQGGALSNLARENIQNSLDAHDPKKPEEAVEILFEKTSLELSEKNIPGIDELEQIFKDHCKYQEERSDRDTRDDIIATRKFFEDNKNKKIDVIKISDSNTTGLEGANESNSKFDNLVFSEGSSLKEGPGGGSFGVGKNAPFAISPLRTVIYSSTYINDKNEKEHALSIKSILGACPIDGSEGEFFNNKVFLTDDNNNGITDKKLIEQKGFLRNEVGTDIYILGIKEIQGFDVNDFVKYLAKEISENYFLSIFRKNLICTIKDDQGYGTTIDYKNIEDRLEENYKLFSRKSDGTAAHFPNLNRYNKPSSYLFFQALKEGAIFEEREIPFLGKVQLHLAFLPKDTDGNIIQSVSHVMRMREILMKVNNHNPSLRYDKSYVSIITVTDEDGSINAAALENERHDIWSLGNVGNPQVREELSKALKAIDKWLDEILKKYQDEGKDFKDFPRSNVLRLIDSGNTDPDEASQLEQEYEETRNIEITKKKIKTWDPDVEVYEEDEDGTEPGPTPTPPDPIPVPPEPSPDRWKYKRTDDFVDGWRAIYKKNNVYKLVLNINKAGIEEVNIKINARSELNSNELKNICDRLENSKGEVLQKNERNDDTFFNCGLLKKGKHAFTLYINKNIKISPEVSFWVKTDGAD